MPSSRTTPSTSEQAAATQDQRLLSHAGTVAAALCRTRRSGSCKGDFGAYSTSSSPGACASHWQQHTSACWRRAPGVAVRRLRCYGRRIVRSHCLGGLVHVLHCSRQLLLGLTGCCCCCTMCCCCYCDALPHDGLVHTCVVTLHSSNWRCVTIHGTNGVVICGTLASTSLDTASIWKMVSRRGTCWRETWPCIPPIYRTDKPPAQAVRVIC